jgi:hypothetical protein
MRQTFVYLATGNVSRASTSYVLTWTAPTSGVFDDLLLWAETSTAMSLQGLSTTVLDGVWFTPNAAVALSGSTSAAGVGLQMFADTLSLNSSGSFKLSPASSRSVQLTASAPALIR